MRVRASQLWAGALSCFCLLPGTCLAHHACLRLALEASHVGRQRRPHALSDRNMTWLPCIQSSAMEGGRDWERKGKGAGCGRPWRSIHQREEQQAEPHLRHQRSSLLQAQLHIDDNNCPACLGHLRVAVRGRECTWGPVCGAPADGAVWTEHQAAALQALQGTRQPPSRGMQGSPHLRLAHHPAAQRCHAEELCAECQADGSRLEGQHRSRADSVQQGGCAAMAMDRTGEAAAWLPARKQTRQQLEDSSRSRRMRRPCRVGCRCEPFCSGGFEGSSDCCTLHPTPPLTAPGPPLSPMAPPCRNFPKLHIPSVTLTTAWQRPFSAVTSSRLASAVA